MELPPGRFGEVPPGFDPWKFNVEALRSSSEPWRGAGEAWLSQALAAHSITTNRVRIESNGYALMDAIALVANNGLVMPDWMAKAYLARWRRIVDLEVDSFEKAFGPLPYKGEKRIRNLKRRRELMPVVSQAVIAAIVNDPHKPMTKDDLFEPIGKELGISGTQADELYREGIRDYGMMDVSELKKVLLAAAPAAKPANS